MTIDHETFWDDDEDWDDTPNPNMADFCPYCKEDYDEIDYEYQICHYCKFNNNKRDGTI